MPPSKTTHSQSGSPPEDYSAQTIVLGNQQWRLLQFQKVVGGRTKKEMLRSAPCENLVPSLKRTHEGVEITGRPGLADIANTVTVPMFAVCILWESVGERYVTKDKKGAVTFLKTEMWKHMYTIILHTFQQTRLASECYATGYGPNNSTLRRIGVTANLSTNSRVEVVQLNGQYQPINWKYPFLTSLETGLQSDSCLCIFMCPSCSRIKRYFYGYDASG